jgi:competence ComEA-like helix-hairpin-helix protein
MDAAAPFPPSVIVPPREQPQAVAWPRAAQVATVFLLGVATTLLAVHGYRGLRWGSRPTELERDALPANQIDLNRADRAELLQVPGIGNSLAQRIEEYRRQHGGFRSVSDLRHVQGIGPTILERLRPWVRVRPAEMDPPVETHRIFTQRPPSPENHVGISNEDHSSGRRSTSKKEAQLTGRIDINQAAVADLQLLPGIGPRRAQLIVEERQKRPFTSIEELRRVSGIGPKTLEGLRRHVVVDSGPMRIVTAGGP